VVGGALPRWRSRKRRHITQGLWLSRGCWGLAVPLVSARWCCAGTALVVVWLFGGCQSGRGCELQPIRGLRLLAPVDCVESGLGLSRLLSVWISQSVSALRRDLPRWNTATIMLSDGV